MKTRCLVIAFFVILLPLRLTYCRNGIYADLDYMRSGIAAVSEKTPVVNIGQQFFVKRLYFGGMVEIRNEPRFNQKVFPNHNWRGTAVLGYSVWSYANETKYPDSIELYIDLFHESAHPTMGIAEETRNAHELIYDHQYRTMMLNSFNCAAAYVKSFPHSFISAQMRLNFYFLSKNTPELDGDALTQGYGFDAGVQWNQNLSAKNSVYVSFHNRLIAKSKNEAKGKVYFGNGIQLTEKTLSYPSINQVYTISLKTGFNHSFGKTGANFGVFTHFIHGNPYGFVDSRDKRSVLRFGIEFFR
ncbi:MAG: hypothetical protein Q4F84_04635 [Fibrobacter sp.]|nr:hypothetical protein [Fibrobacter sp.]